jgi:predicted amidophosphoribosyltransferase
LTAGVDVIPNLYRRAVLTALFPIACPGCGVPAEPVCARCAATLRAPAPSPPPPALDRWAAPFAYEGVARELVARTKYRNVRGVVPWLAARMVDALDGPNPLDERVTAAGVIVTWAPTTPARRRIRGFDPAEVLAREVARQLRRPCRPLVRRLPGPPQTGLVAAARRRGPRVVPLRGAARRVHGARVLVVDDVATTGATLGAVGAVVRELGAMRVVALTAARTPAPSPYTRGRTG